LKLCALRAGSGGAACLDLLVSLGLPMKKHMGSDIKGVVYAAAKEEMDGQ